MAVCFYMLKKNTNFAIELKRCCLQRHDRFVAIVFLQTFWMCLLTTTNYKSAINV